METAEQEVVKIGKDEMRKALKSLKNGKAGFPDDRLEEEGTRRDDCGVLFFF